MLEFEAGLARIGGQQLDKNKLLKTNVLEKTFNSLLTLPF